MSLRRQRVPFKKYADVPSRETTRFRATSLNPAYWPASCPSELSKTNSTDAVPTGLRDAEPLNTTSAMESTRRCLAEISPMTQRTASMMLDLPQPFGPTTPMRLLGKLTEVGSTKDLKPASLILLRRIALLTLVRGTISWRRSEFDDLPSRPTMAADELALGLAPWCM